MKEPNELRGELDITLEGVKYVLRPSYEAIVAIERQTGSSLSILQIAAAAKILSLEQAAIVVTECCRAQGRAIGDQTLAEFNAKSVGHALYDGGLKDAFAVIADLLDKAITGGFTHLGEARAGTL